MLERWICSIRLLILLTLTFACGCTTIRYTQPPRTVTEQFLISYAGVAAVNSVNLNPLQERGVFLDSTNFESIDKSFFIGEIRNAVVSSGAHIVDKKEDAEIILEIRTPGIGIDQKETLFGIPSIPIPIPTVGTLTLPEIAIFKRIKQNGKAGISLTAIDSHSGMCVYNQGPTIGESIYVDWYILGITFRTRKNLP